LKHHPQFEGFLTTIGATAAAGNEYFVVPLLRWGQLPRGQRSRDDFMAGLAKATDIGTEEGQLGWHTTEPEALEAIRAYVEAIEARSEAQTLQNPERDRSHPFRRNQDFVNACEQALVKHAFEKAGTPLDYISMEILRRWCRTLGIANFSYHAPGPYALRFWPTADIEHGSNGYQITRRVGDEWRDRAVRQLNEAYESIRRSDPYGSMWLPIYQVRAAVCWKLRISDSEFDSAILELLRGERGPELPYGINLDQASYGSIPPSERPLVVAAPSGTRIFKSLSLVPRKTVTRERSQP
jgi:hypothetical protein